MEERALRDLAKRGSLRDFRSDDLAEGMRVGGGCEKSDAVVTASKMCAGMSIAMEAEQLGWMELGLQFMFREGGAAEYTMSRAQLRNLPPNPKPNNASTRMNERTPLWPFVRVGGQ